MANKGFSLIELMIVITIIGILAAVAVPSYNDYVVRSKFASILSVARPYQIALEEYVQLNGTSPAVGDNAALGMPAGALSAEVNGVSLGGNATDWRHRIVVLSLDPSVTKASSGQGSLLLLDARIDATTKQITWNCISHASPREVPSNHLPASCQ